MFFADGEEGIDHGGPLGGFMAAGEQVILPSECNPATVCYRAPVGEVYAQFYAANVFWTERDGMVSFCGPQIDPMQPLTPQQITEGMGLLVAMRNAAD